MDLTEVTFSQKERVAGGNADVYAIAYEEGVQMIAGQEATLDSLHARAGTLLSAASLATAFLGAQALKQPHALSHWWGARVAMISFALMALGVIAVLLPYSWVFYNGPRAIIRDFKLDEATTTAETVRRDLALRADDHFERNKKKLNVLFWTFTVSCALLALQLGAWFAELGRGR